MSPSRNELQSRLEKLERTNATLAAAQRDLQRTATDTAEHLSELQDKVDQLETTVAAFGAQRGSKQRFAAWPTEAPGALYSARPRLGGSPDQVRQRQRRSDGPDDAP
jgi:septal ring factor EnvC (AmiA/AmiB activator)